MVMEAMEPRTLLSAAAALATPPAFINANSATFDIGSVSKATIKTSSSLPPTLREIGALPAGLVWNDKGNGKAVISGQPSPGAAGVYVLSLVAKDGEKPNARESYTLTIDQPPSIRSAASTAFMAGAAGAFTIKSKGFPTAQVAETGALPPGLTFAASANGTATISGTPDASATGTYVIDLAATDAIALTATQSLTLSVDQPPAITSAPAATFTTNTAGSFTITTTGYPTSAITEKGPLPPGITFHDNGDGTATLSGTPAQNVFGTFPLQWVAKNGSSPNARQAFTLEIGRPPEIDSADEAAFAVESAGSFTIATSASLPSNPRLTESGALPAGLRFQDDGDGTATIYGTPGAPAAGVYVLNITASNDIAPNAAQQLTLFVGHAPVFQSAAGTTFTAGSQSSFTITTGQSLPTDPAIDESGALPTGVTFHDNGDGTATISGTPAQDSSGIYDLNLTASNGIPNDAAQSFTLTVYGPPTITSGSNATFTTGEDQSFTISTAGLPIGAITETGALPAGLTFKDNGNGSATISGTPASTTGGVYVLDLTASNGFAPNAAQALTITVDQPPDITSSVTAHFTVGTSSAFTITTTGYPIAAITEDGALPEGVVFQDNGNGTATIQGSPALSAEGGNFILTVTADNDAAPSATQTVRLVIYGPPSFTSGPSATLATGVAGSFTVTTSGLPKGSITESGALPDGVTFKDNGNTTATIALSPATSVGGIYTFNLSVDNGIAPDATQTFTLTVDAAPAFTSSSTTTFTQGTPGSFTVVTSGFPSGTITENGALPPGVTFQDNGDGTATIFGTPAQSVNGKTYPIYLTATNGTTPDATQTLSINVHQTLSITSATTTTFTAGEAGSFGFTTASTIPGTPVLTEIGTLPADVSFVDNGNGTATLAGNPGPGTGGAYGLTINGSYGGAVIVAQSFLLYVDEATYIASAPSATFTVGEPGSFTVQTAGAFSFPEFGPDGSFVILTPGGFPQTATLYLDGYLPPGLEFQNVSSGIATLFGTPAPGTAGTYVLTFIADDGVGPETTQTFTLTVL
jgi:hypothetical protein